MKEALVPPADPAGFVSAEAIRAAAERIGPHILRTPVRASTALAAVAGVPVWLKLEHYQTTGSFKLRGATNALLALAAASGPRQVAAASTGNHGRALAHAAQSLGMRAVICMSALVPDNKVRAVAAAGGEIRIIGRSQDDAQREVDRLVAEEGFAGIAPFDHPDVIAGQGSIGLEIAAELPDAAEILVPLSGGGLIAGIAAAVKAGNPKARVIGISMARGAAMAASLAAGRPVEVEEVETLADSLGGGIGLANRHTFAMVRALVDDVILLSEAEIAEGIRFAYEQEGEIIEGAGAVGIAALLAGRHRPRGPAVLVLSGRNIDMATHRRLICGSDHA
jgi:threonine dehydratase